MNIIKIIILATIVVIFSTSCTKTTETTNPVKTTTLHIDSGIRHVVLFKFKEATSKENIKSIEDAFAALPDKVQEIQSLEWSNINISPEKVDLGFTHCYLLTFKNEEDRDIYLPHPAHKAFGDIVGPHLAEGGVLVYDYKF